MSSRAERGTVLAVPVALVLAFLVLRVAVLIAREPFFDELFTVWLAGKPFSAIVPALLHDSGPPLYYFVARIPSVTAERVLSIVFASVPLFVLLQQKRWIAALLLAVHPAAAILSAAARPYALAGALIAIGILLLERERAGSAAAAFVAAAYTHFAAAFFLPLLLFARVSWRRRIVVSAIAAVAFLPGLLLALRQPPEATAWMARPDLAGVLQALAFAGDQPVALGVMLAAFVLTLVAASRSWRLAPLALLPLTFCLGVALFRPAYFPSRFASLLAFPLALWLADSLERWPRIPRRVLIAALVLTGVASIAVVVADDMRRPMDDYRLAATELRRNAPPGATIVATGYLYLETMHQLGENRVQAFPPEQARHPGWRVPPRGDVVDTATLPPGSFLWIGERAAPELAAIRRGRRVAVLYANERAAILRIE